jgi:PAS domain S-box-containing protein
MRGGRPGVGWERLFWLLFERSSNPVLLVDLNRRVIACNDAAASLLRAPRAQLVGTSVADSVVPAERARSEREWRAFLRTGEYMGDRTLLRRDGSHVMVEFAAQLADVDGTRLAFYVMMPRARRGAAPGSERALPLSDREREVVTLIALGHTTGEIARELYISPATVRTHVRNAMAKLKVRTRAQLVGAVLAREHAQDRERLGEAS